MRSSAKRYPLAPTQRKRQTDKGSNFTVFTAHVFNKKRGDPPRKSGSNLMAMDSNLIAMASNSTAVPHLILSQFDAAQSFSDLILSQFTILPFFPKACHRHRFLKFHIVFCRSRMMKEAPGFCLLEVFLFSLPVSWMCFIQMLSFWCSVSGSWNEDLLQKEFLEWQRTGLTPLPVVRMCFVGRGRAGKTTTLRLECCVRKHYMHKR